MKRILAPILMSVAILLASSSCTLKKGELRLLYMEIHAPTRILTNTQFWIRVNFEAEGNPEIRRACFYCFQEREHAPKADGRPAFLFSRAFIRSAAAGGVFRASFFRVYSSADNSS
jgi:hypothetical protein